LKDELDIPRNIEITTKNLRNILKKLVEDPTQDSLAMKVFGLIMINKFICLGYGQRVKEAAMVEGFSFPKFNDTDVCQLVVEELKKAIAAWQVVGAEWRALPGCFIAVLLAYLECIDDPKLNPINKHVPRVLYYNPKKLMELARNDLIKKGTRDPRTWIFGKSPWKAQNDIVFNDEGSRVLPTNVRVHQNKRPISCIPELPPSPKRFKSGPSSSTGVAPQPSSGNFFASTFAELESALSRAAQLSFQLPTTTSRLACISGILPTEESFDEDAHRIVLNAEVGNHEHLQKTISQLRDGFSAYRNMQDSRCKPFEDRANHYFNQIFNEDSTAAAAATDSRREVVDPSEINVVNDDTLDLSQPLASKALVPNSDTPPEVGKTVDSEETLS